LLPIHFCTTPLSSAICSDSSQAEGRYAVCRKALKFCGSLDKRWKYGSLLLCLHLFRCVSKQRFSLSNQDRACSNHQSSREPIGIRMNGERMVGRLPCSSPDGIGMFAREIVLTFMISISFDSRSLTNAQCSAGGELYAQCRIRKSTFLGASEGREADSPS
jgi:hypothetical protein